MKKILFFVAILAVTSAVAQTAKDGKADSIMHIWQTQEKDGKMQILKNESGYYGKMLYGKDLLEADGKTYKKDVNNPDPALRTRLLKDYTLVSGLVFKDGKWIDGKIYDYANGNSYDVNLEIKDGILYMRAFKGVLMFGKTIKWTLVE
ncbi:uncharacterized protein DUF2147 [Mucilaginibacter frigoritolerans]|uniref:Uncharacterized protein DUF2147 n=1 Tax=Mucilaginibacter frigoritolerans TaxID=652788 RepID=A0A562TLF1_9SPHI|nr:DUF2147 domain-containing protein [Mucilaginibacter frigoritolerans]TWI94385.1 uncharacterized protein DUF2147 [Mucilaginibacter frigoritolerans]